MRRAGLRNVGPSLGEGMREAGRHPPPLRRSLWFWERQRRMNPRQDTRALHARQAAGEKAGRMG